MIIEYIRYKISNSNVEAFLEAYRKAACLLDQSKFCLGYELSECEEEPGQFILRIRWTSTDEHINGFRKSELFPEFFTLVKPFFNYIQEMRHYQLTDILREE
jgi:quinol monooxygenase YgiN